MQNTRGGIPATSRGAADEAVSSSHLQVGSHISAGDLSALGGSSFGGWGEFCMWVPPGVLVGQTGCTRDSTSQALPLLSPSSAS